MDHYTPGQPTKTRPQPAHPHPGLLLLLLLLSLGLAGCLGRGQFGPLRATATPRGDFSKSPITVTMSQLAADPYTFRDQLVQVSGTFAPPTMPACSTPYQRGPAVRWTLAADNLLLEVAGYNAIWPRLPEDLPMTVVGIFRRYTGPLGCGKRPPTETIWYLQALHIVSPNPLPLAGPPQPTAGTPIVPPTFPAGTPSPTPDQQTSPTPTLTLTPTGTATLLPGITPSPTGSATPTPTTTATIPAGASPSPTSPPTTTATGTPAPTLPPGSTATPPPPGATNTPPGYPGPTNTPGTYP